MKIHLIDKATNMYVVTFHNEHTEIPNNCYIVRDKDNPKPKQFVGYYIDGEWVYDNTAIDTSRVTVTVKTRTTTNVEDVV